VCAENQPFGHLKIHVRPGVFIPRWETEEWTLALASRLRRLTPSRKDFTVVDLCTGSGCIPLLLKEYVSANIDKSHHSTYGKPNSSAQFIGIEKSATAVEVARANLSRLQRREFLAEIDPGESERADLLRTLNLSYVQQTELQPGDSYLPDPKPWLITGQSTLFIATFWRYQHQHFKAE
jgi:methylase of polypeptide subunit release factors